MGKFLGFQMWEPYRQSLIQNHTFYIEQAQKRLLSQFDNIDDEATQIAENWLTENDKYFDPDRHDEGSFYERSEDVAIEFYGLLSDMQEQTRLSVVAGIFHEWDKKLRDWLVAEIHHWHKGDNLFKKIWSVDFIQIMDFLECLNWQVRNADYYPKLNACRLVVNAYKHGEGNSFQELKDNFPEYLHDPFSGNGGGLSTPEYREYSDLRVNDTQISEFSDAIIKFWKDVPSEVNGDDINQSQLPDWFVKAYNKDKDGQPRKTS